MTDLTTETPSVTETPSLGADFPEADRDAWMTLVESALKGADFEKALTTPLAEGLRIQPIYSADDAPETSDAVMRNAAAADRVRFGWDVRQMHAHPDPAETNKAILSDLERGATSALLRFDAAARRGEALQGGETLQDSVHAGRDGVMIHCLDHLDAAVVGVFMEAAVLDVRAGASFEGAARLMTRLWERHEIEPQVALGHLGADPLGTLAAEGRLLTSVEEAVARMASLAVEMAKSHPKVTTISVDTSAYHAAGADEGMDLAYAMATGIAYLRAMEAAGLSVGQAAAQIQFTLPVGVDAFLGIAKLRAARKLWARILQASGVAGDVPVMRLHAVTPEREVAQRDAWVNMLRATVSCFAAGVGGADSVTVLPYTSALGLPDGFARRIARNVQLLLLEESHLARVIDPAGGSWYVERLTDDLAAAAWEKLQAIEAQGGMAHALTSGSVAEDCAKAWSGRERLIAKRRVELTGVNTFPKVDETPVDVVTPDLKALGAAAVDTLKGGLLVEAADVGTPFEITPLTAHRLGEAFEALRDACDAAAERPKATLVGIGKAADYTARATFARNYLGAGGIAADDLEIGGAADVTQAVGRLAVICSSDTLYADHAEDVARALKAAGASHVLLAGRPGDREVALRSAGIDGFVFAGDDTLATLRSLLAEMGVL
jgi:methylmalonyl-CoA mutase